MRRPANGALMVVGEIDPEALVRDADRALRGWKGDRAAPPAPPPPPSPRAPTIRVPPDVVVARSGAARVAYTEDARRRTADLQFGCFLPPVRTPRDAIVNELLAALLGDGLRSDACARKGVSYAPHVHAETLRGGTAWLSGRVDVDARAQTEALDMLHRWLDDARAFADRLRGASNSCAGRRRAAAACSTRPEQEVAAALFGAWNMGWAPAVLDDYPRELATVTPDEVTAAFHACRARSVITVLGPGPG